MLHHPATPLTTTQLKNDPTTDLAPLTAAKPNGWLSVIMVLSNPLVEDDISINCPTGSIASQNKLCHNRYQI